MQTFDPVVLLDTRFHKVTVGELIDYLIESARQDKKTVVGNVNVRAMNFAYELPWYRKFLNDADLVFCDGFGVLLGANLQGHCLCADHRMTCPDYIEALATACEHHQVSLFLLAGQPGVTDQAIAKLKQVAPQLNVAGHHGYFTKTGAENDQVIEQINRFKPDLLYVGFGMPMQERWILDNFDRLEARVFLPLGACLDFYTDTVYRGPRWLTDRGFEWAARLFTEPKRLWERYLVGNSLFLYRTLIEYLHHRFSPVRRSSESDLPLSTIQPRVRQK